MSTPSGSIPRFFSSVVKAASGTFISRIFGLIRDVLFAVWIPKTITDTFWVAFRIPNLFRRLFGEGALTVSFVPVFQEIEKSLGQSEAKRYFQSFHGVLILILMALIILGWIFAPEIMLWMTPGWSEDSGKLGHAITFLRWCFPYLFFIACVACFMGVQHVRHQFWIPSFSPTLLNWSFILSLCIGVIWTQKLGEEGWIPLLIIGVLVGGVSQYILNMRALIQLRMPIMPKFSIHPQTWYTLGLMFPSVLAVSSLQINHIITSIFASYLSEGSISALYYSSRLVEFPLGMIAVSTAVVLLPRIKSRDTGDIREQSKEIILRVSYILFPITVAAFIGADIWVKLIFNYGKFDASMVELTKTALQWGSFSILGGGFFRILSAFEFSKQKPWVPAALAVSGSIVHYFLCTFLVKSMGIGGIALSVSIISILQAKVMVFINHRPSDFLNWTFLREYYGLLFATILMGGGLYLLHSYLHRITPWVEAPIFIMCGMFIYALSSEIMRLNSWKEWKGIFLNKVRL
jgi:putative peptidoglycan lipid II flippase